MSSCLRVSKTTASRSAIPGVRKREMAHTKIPRHAEGWPVGAQDDVHPIRYHRVLARSLPQLARPKITSLPPDDTRSSAQRMNPSHVLRLVSRMSRVECGRESLRLALQPIESAMPAKQCPAGWGTWWKCRMENKPTQPVRARRALQQAAPAITRGARAAVRAQRRPIPNRIGRYPGRYRA